MLVSDGGSRNAAEEQLRELRQKEGSLIDDICRNDGTTGQKFLELAQTIEDRINFADTMLPKYLTINQISTYITRLLKAEEDPPAAADHVNRYLPEKYKNANMMRFDPIKKEIEQMENVLNCNQVGCKPIEECSNAEMEAIYEKRQELNNELDTAKSNNAKELEKIEWVAYEKKFQLSGTKFRRQISEKDFDEEVPEILESKVKINVGLFNKIGKGFIDIAEKYSRAPPREHQELDEDKAVLSTFYTVLEPYKDTKHTGEMEHAFEREYIKDTQSKHAAGNSDKFPTRICKKCSDLESMDLHDVVIMRYDPTQELYKCRKCQGTEFVVREMTREQVGDRSAYTVAAAVDVLRWLPLLGTCLKRWNTKWIQPKEDSRKAAIAQFFSDSAIANISWKVAKKVKTD